MTRDVMRVKPSVGLRDSISRTLTNLSLYSTIMTTFPLLWP
jgi:hypothetical protein